MARSEHMEQILSWYPSETPGLLTNASAAPRGFLDAGAGEVPLSLRRALACLLACSSLACGASTTTSDTGTHTGPTDAGTAATIISTGTVDAVPAGLVIGYARLGSDGSALLIATSEASYACPASPASFAPHANQTGVDIMVWPADGGTLVGTFPFSSRGGPGTALGFAFRTAAVCPADYGDGVSMTSGSLTLSGTSGALRGSFDATLSGGETLSAQFSLPLCNIGGIAGACQP
jgi:hypothetical protein